MIQTALFFLTIYLYMYMYTYIYGASQVAQSVKHFACNAGNLSSIPGSGSFPGEGNGNPFQYSFLPEEAYG